MLSVFGMGNVMRVVLGISWKIFDIAANVMYCCRIEASIGKLYELFSY